MYVPNFSHLKITANSSHSIITQSCSFSVRDLDANIMGLPSYMNAATKSLLEAST